MNTFTLEPKLGSLNLGGMLQTLEARLSQAHDHQLGHVEFLEMLLEDEIARRQSRSLQARINRAHFDEVKTLAEFDFSFNPKIPASQIRDLASCRYLERKESVILCGPVGLGKSHIAQGLGWEACARGYTVLFAKTSRMLADLGAGHLDGTWEERLRRYLKPHLLICDDFAMRDFTAQQSEDLYELVGERVRAGSTITTANRAPVDWYPLFPNPVLVEGILDRLLNSAHQILMAGRSYRPQQRPDRAISGREGPLGPETGLVAENRAAQMPQDARNHDDAAQDTPESDPEEVIASRHSRPSRGR
jgi:DNA replication protein DnaC